MSGRPRLESTAYGARVRRIVLWTAVGKGRDDGQGAGAHLAHVEPALLIVRL